MKIPDFNCKCAFDICCQQMHDPDYMDSDSYDFVGNTTLRNTVHLAIQFDQASTWFKSYQISDYEPREIGNWRVGRFTVDDIGAFLHNREFADPGKWIVPGEYTALYLRNAKEKSGWQVIMSDTPSEIGDHLEFIDKAYGRVLINGLGLGMVAHALLREDKETCIEHIDIVEYNQEVIDLVGHHFKDNPKVTIHHADAFEIEWPEDTYWHCAWHDIWYEINPDDVKQHEILFSKYADRVVYQDAWMNKWLKGFLEWNREAEAK